MSRSLHSSMEYFCSSKRWSRKLSDMEPEKSSMGEVSPTGGLGLRHASLPALVAEQPVEALRLEGEQVRNFQGFADLRERETAGSRTSSGHSLGRVARGSQGWSFHGPSDVKSAHTLGPGSTQPVSQQKLRPRRRVETLGSAKRQHTCIRARSSSCHSGPHPTASRRAPRMTVRGPGVKVNGRKICAQGSESLHL